MEVSRTHVMLIIYVGSTCALFDFLLDWPEVYALCRSSTLVPRNESDPDVPVRMSDPGVVYLDGLVVVLEPVALHHLERHHVELQLGEPLSNTGPGSVTEGQVGVGVYLLVGRTLPQPPLRHEPLWLRVVPGVRGGQPHPQHHGALQNKI